MIVFFSKFVVASVLMRTFFMLYGFEINETEGFYGTSYDACNTSNLSNTQIAIGISTKLISFQTNQIQSPSLSFRGRYSSVIY